MQDATWDEVDFENAVWSKPNGGNAPKAWFRRSREHGPKGNAILKCVSDTHVLEFVAKIDILQRSEDQA